VPGIDIMPRPEVDLSLAIVVTPYLVGLRGARKLSGVRCTKFLDPGVPMLTFGDRCTKFFDPGVPVLTRGARCTDFPEPVEAKGFGKVMRGFLGFAPIVV
jgi:hypothetical protein